MRRRYVIRRTPDGVTCTVEPIDPPDDPYDLWTVHQELIGARHSPDGFEFGYSGSGPAELARAILSDLHGRPVEGYQDLKWSHIATLPPEGGELMLELNGAGRWRVVGF